MNYEEMIKAAEGRIKSFSKRIVIAVDGRCASGKTVFAGKLADDLEADLLHMDDFFLRPVQRTKQRYAAPGENVDHERFEEEVLKPLTEGKEYFYQPFDCRKMELGNGRWRIPGRITIVEGSYSMHPELIGYYDLKIFLTVKPDVQIHRIEIRNPDKVNDFKDKWIPYEEKYFMTIHPERKADYLFDTSDLF